MKKTLGLAAIVVQIIFWAASGLPAQTTERETRMPETKAAPLPPVALEQEESSVTEHAVRIGGQVIPYKATASTMYLKNEQGEPIALMYSAAYTRSDVKDPSARPISFLYNGGPGSASMWLHMGAFGPRRAATTDAAPTPPPPYALADNAESLLDKSDLVFIDAIGTGFSHAVGKAQNSDFYGIDEDVQAFGQYILNYVNRFNRWNSPKFLIGESYGTFRSAVLGNFLQSRYGMHLNGIVLISNVLDFSSLMFSPSDDRTYAYYLPSYAAVAWYHNALKDRPADLAAFIEEARRYAGGDYLTALFKGDRLPPQQRAAVAKRLSAFTGLAEDYLIKANLRVSLGQFNVELLRSKGLTSGRIDARFTGYTRNLLSETAEGDPEGPAVGGAFTALLNVYNQNDLKFGRGKTYKTSSGGGGWNWTRLPTARQGAAARGGGYPSAPNALADLLQAMITNPNLLVQVENGYYDMATPFFATEITMDHLGLRPEMLDRIKHNYYEAGHMMYLQDASRVALKNNVAAFIDKATRRQAP